jgi:hypothetical protein
MADLFEQINAVWEGDKSITTKTKPVSVYMTTRFISLSDLGFHAARQLNSYGTLPEWIGLPYLKITTPNRRAPRNAYPKKITEKISDKDKKTLTRICSLFNVDEFHGKQIKALLEAQNIKIEGN